MSLEPGALAFRAHQQYAAQQQAGSEQAEWRQLDHRPAEPAMMVEHQRHQQLADGDRGQRQRRAHARRQHDADDDEEGAKGAAGPDPPRRARHVAEGRCGLARRHRQQDQQRQPDDELSDGRPERPAQHDAQPGVDQ